ncbi:hypothetical protein RZS08_06140 [Arthrospira platensis SPKY1]|nr:hypothetical protein [Arthrospira platensis SPKY1]
MGAGIVGGALIGTGIGAPAGIGVMMAVGAGVGVGAAAEGYMLNNYRTRESFDRTDFVITTAVSGIEGAVAAHPAIGPMGRIGTSIIAGGVEPVLSDLAHNQSISGSAAVYGIGKGFLSGVGGELLSGGISVGSRVGGEAEFIDLTKLVHNPAFAPRTPATVAFRTATRNIAQSVGIDTMVEWLFD